MGSSKILVDASGTIKAGYDYTPFGEHMRETGSWDTRYQFTGQEKDEETGLYNYRARLYDPYLKRFLDTDPAGQGFSPYAYAGNNPVYYVDPDGEIFVPMLIGAGIGVLTNGAINSIEGRGFFEGAIRSAVMGGIGGAMSFGIGEMTSQITNTVGRLASQTLLHGYLGGYMTMASGGEFASGFFSGGLGTLAASGSGALLKNSHWGLRFAGMTATSGVVGGLGSEMFGGQFWDGFRNGAISGGLNDAIHLMTWEEWVEFKKFFTDIFDFFLSEPDYGTTVVDGVEYQIKGGVAPSPGIGKLGGTAKTIGILRDAAKYKGNFSLGKVTYEEAMQIGKAWVGKEFSINKKGIYMSKNGLRQFRPPSYKPKLKLYQANLEWRLKNLKQWQGNGHLTIK